MGPLHFIFAMQTFCGIYEFKKTSEHGIPIIGNIKCYFSPYLGFSKVPAMDRVKGSVSLRRTYCFILILILRFPSKSIYEG